MVWAPYGKTEKMLKYYNFLPKSLFFRTVSVPMISAGADSHFTIQAESGGKTGRIVGQFSPFHSAIQAMLLEFN